VTVEEYRHFVDDRGYDTPRFWSTEGWERRGAENWQSPDDPAGSGPHGHLDLAGNV
jgi:formylglycine-generating enzyme required for sulfatase activity